MPAKDLRAWLRTSPLKESRGGSARAPDLGLALILRSPFGYTCGLCQREHATFSQAHECLERCQLHYRLGVNVHTLESPRGELYRCSLCARVRVHREDALRCFESCHHRLLHERRVPAQLEEALALLKPHEAQTGPKPRVLAKGPLFRGGGALSSRANEGLVARGVLLAGAGSYGVEQGGESLSSASPSRGRRAHPLGAGAPSSKALSSPMAWDKASEGEARRKAVSAPLSKEELARRTSELFGDDLPEGANVEEGDSLTFGAHADDPFAPPGPEVPALDSPTEGGAEPFVASLPRETERDGDEPAASMDAPDEAPSAAPPAEEKEPMRRADGSIIIRKPHMKPFKRADAKYVCGACETRYFTKSEAEKCFVDHPLDEMV